ncbi:MAG: hypothetical protein RMK64_06730 [Rhodovarius sp.]|nr:hypothetical protein [Rhodovarius sp.]
MPRKKAFLTACLLLLLAWSQTAAAQGTRGAVRETQAAPFPGTQLLPELPRLGAAPVEAKSTHELAPRPRLDLEGPRAVSNPHGQPQIAPAFIAPRLPGRGFAQENASPGSINERLFRPAPGARVSIPMSW